MARKIAIVGLLVVIGAVTVLFLIESDGLLGNVKEGAAVMLDDVIDQAARYFMRYGER
jgi:hypothetical protein